jgi:hypothetical protein
MLMPVDNGSSMGYIELLLLLLRKAAEFKRREFKIQPTEISAALMAKCADGLFNKRLSKVLHFCQLSRLIFSTSRACMIALIPL